MSTQTPSVIVDPPQSKTLVAQHPPSDTTSPTQDLSIEARTFERLFARYGPLVSAGDACKTLDFPTLDSFNRAIQRKRLPLKLIRPPGRRKAFVSTSDLAAYLAGLATEVTA